MFSISYAYGNRYANLVNYLNNQISNIRCFVLSLYVVEYDTDYEEIYF